MPTTYAYNAPAVMATQDFSQLIGASAVQIWNAGTWRSVPLSYMRIWNVSATATIWVSRSGTAVVNGAGSFPLGPGLYETFITPQAVPTNALSIIASGASTPVTIEVG